MKRFSYKTSAMILLACVLPPFVACKTAPPVPPESSDAGAVVVVAMQRNPVFISYYDSCWGLYFIKVDSENDLRGHELVQATYKNDEQFYLLNAAPGKYALAACVVSYRSGGGAITVVYLLNEQSVRQTMFELRPGTTHYIGVLQLKSAGGELDPVQSHYGGILAPKRSAFDSAVSATFLGGPPPAAESATIHELDQSQEVFSTMRETARSDWEDSPWAGMESRE